MFRNQYDTDVTTFSPQGRIHQVEYAMEAVKQGSDTVGIRSDTHVCLAAIKRSASELASYQEKIFKIDSHIGISISGLIADARVLARYMRNECLNHEWAFESRQQVGRLVRRLSDKSQVYTQKAEKRPYGVGMLVAGYDKTGPHLYETRPSGDYFEYIAQAIGSRPQACKTYFEKNYESFAALSEEGLIKQAIMGLKAASQSPLTTLNCSVCVVGKDTPYRLLSEAELAPYIAELLDNEGNADADAEKSEEENEEDAAMEQ